MKSKSHEKIFLFASHLSSVIKTNRLAPSNDVLKSGMETQKTNSGDKLIRHKRRIRMVLRRFEFKSRFHVLHLAPSEVTGIQKFDTIKIKT